MNYNIKRSIDGFVRLLPAGLVMWALYDLLMLAIGGKNAAYGTGLLQWNYVQWILASRDTWVFSPSFQIFWSFFYLPVLFGALSGSLIFSLRTRYGGERLSRRLWAYALIVDLSLQCSALFMAYPVAGFHFWWPTPKTYVPVSSIWLFQITRIVLWFLTPFLLYWFALFVRRLWKKRHGLPPETPPVEETHLS